MRADALARPGAPSRVDLPCGRYYLDRIQASSPITIAVHGHTAVFVGGSVEVTAGLTFAVDPDATLDLYVGGTLSATGALTVGSPAYPARSRVYVGGVCKAGGVSCQSGGDCCSLSCSNGQCGSGDHSRPFSVQVSSQSRLAGLFWAGNGGFVTSGELEMYGAIFAGHYQASSRTAIHYDAATTRIGRDECAPQRTLPPAPPTPVDGGPAAGDAGMGTPPAPDAGTGTPPAPDAGTATPPGPGGCTPRDDDADGYMACDCFTPTMSCAAGANAPTCVPDCCDRPGDPGCPASVTTAAAAATINPGRVDRNCDQQDNNCAREEGGRVTEYVCRGGTDMCLIP